MRLPPVLADTPWVHMEGVAVVGNARDHVPAENLPEGWLVVLQWAESANDQGSVSQETR